MILSILTPSVPSRLAQMEKLCAEIERQAAGLAVEHLVLLDRGHKRGGLTVGEKRDRLLRAAHGDYVSFVDDDDGIAPDYVSALLQAAQTRPDVITFHQHSTVNGQVGKIEFHLGAENEPFRPGSVARRNAWHICAWRRSLAILSH